MNPRSTRDMDRGKRAAVARKAAGGSCLQCMEAQIDATFSAASIHNRIKRECDLAIRKGAGSDHVTAWYRPIARDVSDCTLDQAISAVKIGYLLKKRQRLPLLGREQAYTSCAPHLHVERIYGALVMLRMMRAKKFTNVQFQELVGRIIGQQQLMLEAAE